MNILYPQNYQQGMNNERRQSEKSVSQQVQVNRISTSPLSFNPQIQGSQPMIYKNSPNQQIQQVPQVQQIQQLPQNQQMLQVYQVQQLTHQPQLLQSQSVRPQAQQQLQQYVEPVPLLSNNVQIVSSPQQIIMKNSIQPPQQQHIIQANKQVIQTASFPQGQSFNQEYVSTNHSQVVYNSNDELLIKELEAFKKKCAHLDTQDKSQKFTFFRTKISLKYINIQQRQIKDQFLMVQNVVAYFENNDLIWKTKETHILQFRQKLEVVKITETQLTEVLSENRNLTLKNNELIFQLNSLKHQMEQINLRLNQANLFESEYKKIQDIYNQQLHYIDQLKNELIGKNSRIQDLMNKDDENQRIIKNLMDQLQDQQAQQEDNLKRSKKDKQNSDKDYQDKIDLLNLRLQEKDKEIQNILFALSNSENTKNQWELQILNFQETISFMQKEIKAKDDIINTKNGEIDRLREQNGNLQMKIHHLGNLEQEKNRLHHMLDNKNQEIEQWKKQYNEQTAKIDELRQLNSKIYTLENKIVALNLEIERLHQMNDQKEEDVKRSRNRNAELEKDSDEKKQLLLEKSQMDIKISLYITEIENINRIIQQKQAEIDDLKNKVNQGMTLQYHIQHQETIINNLNIKITNYEQEINAVRQYSHNIEIDNDNLKKQIQELTFKIQNLSQELSSLKNITSDYHSVRQSISESEYKVNNLSQNINNLNITIQQKDQEIERWRSQCIFSQEENERLKKTLNEMSVQMHQMESALQEMNSQLIYLNNVQQQKNDLQKIIEDLRIRFGQMEIKYEQLLKTSTFEKEQLENKVVLLSTENQRKDVIIQARMKEIDDLRSQLLQFTEIQIQFKQNQEKIQYLLSEIDRLNKDNQILTQDLNTLRYKYAEISHLEYRVQDLLVKIVLYTAEIETLRTLLGQNRQETDTLRNSQLFPYRY